MIADMQKLLAVPVFAYSDIQGAHITEAGSDESGRYRDNRSTTQISHKVPLIKICMLAVILREPWFMWHLSFGKPNWDEI